MTARIPLSSPDITQAEIDAVTAVLRTPQLSLGPELAAFEAALAAYHSVPYAVAVSSGTAGLHLALLTLGIGEGHEVIVPSFAFVAVANAVLQVRATPVFAEIDPVTLNLDPVAVARAITPRTRTISWFVYVVRLPEFVSRDHVQAELARCGIASSRYFAPIHLQPAWRNQPCAGAASLPVTESIARRTLALPFFNRITVSQQQEVAAGLRAILLAQE